MTECRENLRRMSSVAHRLEARGFCLAEQILSEETLDREARDDAFRKDMAPLRYFLRPHAFPDRGSRDAACGAPMLGYSRLRPVTADRLGTHLVDDRSIGIGPRVADPLFKLVASAIADPEIATLVRRFLDEEETAWGNLNILSTVVTVFGTHYQLLIDEWGEPQVQAKCPFEALPKSEVEETVMWLHKRLWSSMYDG